MFIRLHNSFHKGYGNGRLSIAKECNLPNCFISMYRVENKINMRSKKESSPTGMKVYLPTYGNTGGTRVWSFPACRGTQKKATSKWRFSKCQLTLLKWKVSPSPDSCRHRASRTTSSRLRSGLCWAKEFMLKLARNQREELSNEAAGDSPTFAPSAQPQGPAYLSGVYGKLWHWTAWQEAVRLLCPLPSPSLQGWCWPWRLSCSSAKHPPFEDTEASDTYVPVVTGKLQRSSYEVSWETQSVLGGDLGQVSWRAFSKPTRYSFKHVGGIHSESESPSNGSNIDFPFQTPS